MALQKVTVAGYKSIERAEVELRGLNVLIGANGAGKSNFVAIFELLREVVEGRLQVHVERKGGADVLLRFGRKHTEALELEFDLGPHGYSLRLSPSEDGGLFIEREACWQRSAAGEAAQAWAEIGAGSRESGLEGAAGSHPIAAQVLEAMRSWRVYHFHDTSSTAKVKQRGSLGDMHALRPDASNLAAFLYRLQQTAPTSFALVNKMVQRVAPFFERFELRPFAANQEQIQLEWRERGSRRLLQRPRVLRRHPALRVPGRAAPAARAALGGPARRAGAGAAPPGHHAPGRAAAPRREPHPGRGVDPVGDAGGSPRSRRARRRRSRALLGRIDLPPADPRRRAGLARRLLPRGAVAEERARWAPAIEQIGLPRVRAECPHFDGWLRRIEALTTTDSLG